MLEVKVVSVDEGGSMPKDCFLSLRVGDTQRLSRLAAARVFRFPEKQGVGKSTRRYGRIEIYQRIGACLLDVDPTSADDRDVKICCGDAGFGVLGLTVAVADAEPEKKPPPEDVAEKSAKKVKAAKQYLNKHGIEVQLSQAMQALLKEKPENPAEFLAARLVGRTPPLSAAPRPLTQPDIPAPTEPNGRLEPRVHKEVPVPTSPPHEKPSAARPVEEPSVENDGEKAHYAASASPENAGNEASATSPTRGQFEQMCSTAHDLLTSSARNGQLDEVLLEVRQDTDEVFAKEVRKKACRILAESAANGKLEDVLQGRRGAPSHNKAPKDSPPSEEHEVVRLKACQLLEEGATNGELEKVLRAVRADDGEGEPVEAPKDSPPGEEHEIMRLRASKLLEESATNGELERALRAVRADDGEGEPVEVGEYIQDVRAKTRDLLIESAENGALEAMLHELRKASPESRPAAATIPAQGNEVGDDIEDVRAKTRDLLIESAENGALEAMLRELRKTPPESSLAAATIPAQGNEVDSGDQIQKYRHEMAEILVACAEDGRLERVLASVLDGSDPAQDGLTKQDAMEVADDCLFSQSVEASESSGQGAQQAPTPGAWRPHPMTFANLGASTGMPLMPTHAFGFRMF